MAVPPNTTPATAVDITTLPFTATLNVTDAPQSITNIPGCVSVACNTVWYKYTAPAGVEFIQITCFPNSGSSGTYNPNTSIWTGTVGSLTLLQSSGGNDYCIDLKDSGGNLYFRLPVTAGDDYWIQIVNDNEVQGSSPSILDLIVQKLDNVTAPIGSFVISDDEDDFPVAIFSPSGSFLQYRSFPAGEFTATQPDGTVCTQNGANIVSEVVLLDSLWVQIGSAVSFGAESVAGVFSDNNGFFYVYTTSGTNYKIYKIDATDGSIIDSFVPTSGAANAMVSGSPSPDGTTFYIARNNSGTPEIDVWDISGGTLSTTLTPTLGANWVWKASVEGFTNSSGNIFLKALGAGTTTKVVQVNQTTGAVIATFLPASNMGFIHRICYISDTYFGIWGLESAVGSGNRCRFQYRTISGGAVFSETDVVFQTNSSYITSKVNEPDEISNSCPVFVLSHALSGPVEPNMASGLYYIERGKRNDTIYTGYDPVTSEDVEIPNPFIETYFAGDE